MLCNKSIDKFQYIYDMLINESKNVPVPDQLAQDILNNFEYKNKIVYRKVDLMQLSKDYQYLSKHSKYTLTVFIINPEDVEETFSKSDYRELKYDLSWNDIYYLCSKDEFESFCTSIEEHKKEFDKHILANLIDYTLSGKILEQPKQLRNLYLFIFVNLLFDEYRKRIEYIEEHLN